MCTCHLQALLYTKPVMPCLSPARWSSCPDTGFLRVLSGAEPPGKRVGNKPMRIRLIRCIPFLSWSVREASRQCNRAPDEIVMGGSR